MPICCMTLDDIMHERAGALERALHYNKLGMSVLVPFPGLAERYLLRTMHAYNAVDLSRVIFRATVVSATIGAKYGAVLGIGISYLLRSYHN